MEAAVEFRNVSFAYPQSKNNILDNISFSVMPGEFIVICGKSGCGKTTMLRQLKTVLAPHGRFSGEILFNGRNLAQTDMREQSGKIGFVMQNPDNQIVTDKVWHELAFGLESLGYKTEEIRRRVSEMASFFGIQNWFYKSVAELSGGQKQLLNLASIMAMQPDLIILDEPTSQLDPIAAEDFLSTIGKINRELGITVVMTEHRLEEVFPLCSRVIVMEEGKIFADGTPSQCGEKLNKENHAMFLSMPSPMRIYAELNSKNKCPVTVREGREWLNEYSEHYGLKPIAKKNLSLLQEIAVELKDVWFRYDRELPDVLKGVNLRIHRSEIYSILGGNGTGKSTTVSVISGIKKAYRGQVIINGKNFNEISDRFNGILGVLPQNPQALLVKKTVYEDLEEMLPKNDERKRKVQNAAALCDITELLDRHPYDLSGGEQQRAALAKVLLTNPEILILDEPTKGLDSEFKQTLAAILESLKEHGVTIIMVSHDIEFCAEYSDRCALFFDGAVTAQGEPRNFFSGNSFYTTSANRMARKLIDNAVTADDVVEACGGERRKHKKIDIDSSYFEDRNNKTKNEPEKKSFWKRLFFDDTNEKNVQTPEEKRKLSARTAAASAMILLAIPLTIFVGIYFFSDRKYYFISLLVIIEAMIPFAMVFESRRPKARELMVISVLCAITVAGRAAFFMIPQFKPVAALVIIAGVAFGGETGFLVGAVSGFVSNFFFGQGPWTPWQMFSFGIIGFIAGVLFRKGLLRRSRLSLAIFGAFVTVVIYGGLMNPASVFMFQAKITKASLLSAYAMGFPFDLIHALSTFIFLFLISKPMLEKLDRIKVKYGLAQ